MGVIRRQGIKHSITAYISILIGAITVLAIYPTCFKEEEIGLIQFLIAFGMLLYGLVAAGSTTLVVKFFPYFRDEKNHHNGFLAFLLLLPLVGIVFSLLLVFFFKDMILAQFSDKSPLFTEYLLYLIPLTYLLAYINIFDKYAVTFKRIVIPNILLNVVLKIGLAVLALLYFYQYISFSNVIQGVIWTHLVILIGFVVYTYALGHLLLKPKFDFLSNKPLVKEMKSYGFYGLIGGLGSIVATRIDTIMVASLIDLKEAGIFAIALFISNVISVPEAAITKISSTINAQAFKDNDMKLVADLYKKTALNQFLAGLFIFIGIWASIDNLFALIPNGSSYALGKYVVLILGLAKLVNMLTGTNSQLIGYSQYYRYNFYFTILLAILNIFANITLIPIFYIEGAALATLLSMVLYNVIKCVFIWQKMRMQPLSKNVLWAIVVALISYGTAMVLPSTSINFLDMLIKSVTITVIFASLVIYFRISPEVNKFLLALYKRFIVK